MLCFAADVLIQTCHPETNERPWDTLALYSTSKYEVVEKGSLITGCIILQAYIVDRLLFLRYNFKHRERLLTPPRGYLLAAVIVVTQIFLARNVLQVQDFSIARYIHGS